MFEVKSLKIKFILKILRTTLAVHICVQKQGTTLSIQTIFTGSDEA